MLAETLRNRWTAAIALTLAASVATVVTFSMTRSDEPPARGMRRNAPIRALELRAGPGAQDCGEASLLFVPDGSDRARDAEHARSAVLCIQLAQKESRHAFVWFWRQGIDSTVGDGIVLDEDSAYRYQYDNFGGDMSCGRNCDGETTEQQCRMRPTITRDGSLKCGAWARAPAPPDAAAPCSEIEQDHVAFRPRTSVMRVCPGRGEVGDVVTITGVNCSESGDDVYVYFHGDLTAEEMGSDDDRPLGRVPTDGDGRFTIDYTIPPEIGPYQTRGGGPVRAGPYGFGTKPPYCEVGFEVVD